jgi:hypothetical protein
VLIDFITDEAIAYKATPGRNQTLKKVTGVKSVYIVIVL